MRLLVVLAALTALAAWLGPLDWRLALLQHGRPYLAAWALFLTLAALLLRLRITASLAAAAVLAAVLPVMQALEMAVAGGSGGRPLRLMTANLLYRNGESEALVSALLAADADILLLQEVTELHLPQLGRLADRYPYAAPSALDRRRGDLVLSRLPFATADALYRDDGATLWRLSFDVGLQHPLLMLTGHPLPPLSDARIGAQADWLAAAAAAARQQIEAGGLVILAGDLNATPWSTAFQNFVTGSGLVLAGGWANLAPTFPQAWPAWLGVAVDHILVAPDIAVADYRLFPLPGSDHRGVAAEVILPLPLPSQSGD